MLRRTTSQRSRRHRAVAPLRIACALLLSVLAAPALAQSGDLDQQVFEIAAQLRCPVCVSESVADSSSRVSIEMREIVQQQLEEGRSEREILAFFQERYGDWILLEPPRRGIHLLVWLLPLVVGLAGIGALALFVRRWLRAGEDVPDVDEAEIARVREALSSSERRAGEEPS